MARGPGKGKTNNPNGRGKGVSNKVTTEAREIFKDVMSAQMDRVQGAMDKVYKKDPAKYLDLLSKLLPYFMPKHVDITSGGKEINKIELIRVNTKDEAHEDSR